MEFGIATFITDDGIRPDVLGRALEERGFDSLFIAEHSHIPASRKSPWPSGGDLPEKYYRTLDPFVALAAAASVTQNLLLGTGIALVIQRDVIHTAKEVATLDLVSDGRMHFGVGVGWNREEMSDHGTDPRTRGALLNEQLAALKSIWTEEPAEFHGKFVDFDPMYLRPKPVQRPHPPIYVGGESEAALERLAKYGDAWLPRPVATPEEINRVRSWLADRGRTDVGVSIFNAGTDPAKLAGWAEAGVDRVTLSLDTLPEAETLAKLDELADAVRVYRNG
ncbi:MAG: TIGR03619 family F420-dependent LLM class oxidoreductase [Streptosporangiales bacterium]|nr:TIGR03619 family F420-dependent LLM class oxidoreductase [Streptosporangiales bacterium]